MSSNPLVTSSNHQVTTKKMKITAKQHTFDIKTSINLPFEENLVPKLKYIPNAMKLGNQSRWSSLIINMIFEIADLDPKLKTWSRNCNVPDFYKIWPSEQIEHSNYECINWYWWYWRKIIDSGKFGPKTEMCSSFHEIWHSGHF